VLTDLSQAIPDLVLDIRYATSDNFTGQPVYPGPWAFLEEEPARRLADAVAEFARHGYRLKLFDGYRPLSVQRIFWQFMPDPRYIADPAVGSRHNRGAAVDVTLVDATGAELAMPSGYDEFSERAHRDYPASPVATRNRACLQDVMERHGWLGHPHEWWHFDAHDWANYPVRDEPLESLRFAV
jgi:D-alanyl-D-alanine dipeptidase